MNLRGGVFRFAEQDSAARDEAAVKLSPKFDIEFAALRVEFAGRAVVIFEKRQKFVENVVSDGKFRIARKDLQIIVSDVTQKFGDFVNDGKRFARTHRAVAEGKKRHVFGTFTQKSSVSPGIFRF